MLEENLIVERVDFYQDIEKCHVFDQMKEEDTMRIVAALKTMKGWSITVNENARTIKDDSVAYNGPYKAVFEINEDNLCVTVCGRVDSITSNDLLEKYNDIKNYDKYKDIVIDGTNLTYISSAGLRVLLIMKKDIKDGEIVLKNISDGVKEILETTGFEDVVKIQ